jgi:hypothetical protein
MMGVDGEPMDAGTQTGIDDPLHQRPIVKRHQRLGKTIGQGPQPRPKSRTKNEYLPHLPPSHHAAAVAKLGPADNPYVGSFEKPRFPGVCLHRGNCK